MLEEDREIRNGNCLIIRSNDSKDFLNPPKLLYSKVEDEERACLCPFKSRAYFEKEEMTLLKYGDKSKSIFTEKIHKSNYENKSNKELINTSESEIWPSSFDPMS